MHEAVAAKISFDPPSTVGTVWSTTHASTFIPPHNGLTHGTHQPTSASSQPIHTTGVLQKGIVQDPHHHAHDPPFLDKASPEPVRRGQAAIPGLRRHRARRRARTGLSRAKPKVIQAAAGVTAAAQAVPEAEGERRGERGGATGGGGVGGGRVGAQRDGPAPGQGWTFGGGGAPVTRCSMLSAATGIAW